MNINTQINPPFPLSSALQLEATSNHFTRSYFIIDGSYQANRSQVYWWYVLHHTLAFSPVPHSKSSHLGKAPRKQLAAKSAARKTSAAVSRDILHLHRRFSNQLGDIL
jgi:hypothetical protein